jgi:dipeptidyl aminopeptidase/acylaminoacyl peptidase
MLRKDRDLRYQTTQILLNDLQTLSESFGSDAQQVLNLRRTSTGTDELEFGRAASITSNAQSTAQERGRSTYKRAVGIADSFRHSVSVLPTWKPKRLTKAALIVFALFLATGGMFYISQRVTLRSHGPEALQTMRFTPLEIPSEIKEAAISPDGKYVAAVLQNAGKQSLIIKGLTTPTATQLVAPKTEQYQGLTFSPDSNYVYFLKKQQESGVLFRINRLGGTPQQLLLNINTPVTFSPDGRSMAFVRYDVQEQATILMTAEADGTNEQTIAVRKSPEIFTLGGFLASGPAWSPNGQLIACPTRNLSGTSEANIVAVNVTDLTTEQINVDSWSTVEQIAWLADNSGLVMNAAKTDDAPLQIWFLPFQHGPSRRITNDPNFYASISLSRDSGSLLAVKSERLSSIWLVSPNDLSSDAAWRIASTKAPMVSHGRLTTTCSTPPVKITARIYG